jgi:hypothetical protein
MKSVRVLMCVVVLASVAAATVGAPLQAAETSTSKTSTIVVSPSVSSEPFTWSQQTLTAGTTLEASKLVSSKIKGTSTYRATGACSLRKGVLYFNRVGKCRVSVSVKLKNTRKVLRSSKVFVVIAKEIAPPPSTSGMPDPIGCVKASSHPLTGQPFPDSAPGYYELLIGWTCDDNTLDARPLLEYFKSQGWTKKSTTAGTVSADLYKGSSRASYGLHYDGMPEGTTLLMLKID